MSKGPKAGSLKVRPGSGEGTSLTAGAQDLSREPGRKAGVGQSRDDLGKHVEEFELTLRYTEQTRAAPALALPSLVVSTHRPPNFTGRALYYI